MTILIGRIVAVLPTLCLCAFIGLLAPEKCYGEELEDTWGREFFFAFPPNFHNNATNYEDSLFVFVTARETTTVRLSYSGRYFFNGLPVYEEFEIVRTIQPGQTETFDVPFRTLAPGSTIPSSRDMFFELEGFNMQGSQALSSRRQNGQIAKQVFQLTADNEVSVYALNQSRTTSDAMVVLPTDILDRNYAILTYNSDFVGIDQANSTPSQFAVVATENNTEIEFELSASAQDEFSNNFSIELQRGEAYLIQAQNINSSANPDMTGSFVKASKPIAVFAGHQRATVPTGNGVSRDMLLEQVPPISTLGHFYFVTPFPVPEDVTSSNGDMFRVLAILDNTDVVVDGITVATLLAGEIYEAPLIEAHEVKSTKPILVGAYKKTSQLSNQSNAQGDPFLMYMPPVEQYMREYQVTNAITFEEEAPGNPNTNWIDVYQEQYISIVLPTTAVNSAVVDGSNIPSNSFDAIGNSGYSYTTLRVAGGVHNVRADTIFGINVFGYGRANSYGYVGGMQFRKIFGPSLQLDSTAECFGIKGEVQDTLALDIDTRVQWVEFPEEFQQNVQIEISDIDEPVDSIGFEVTLVDQYKDGYVRVVSANEFEYRVESDIAIPGFDVHVDPTLRGVDVVTSGQFVWYSREVDYVYELTNSSFADHVIEELFLKDNAFGIEVQPLGVDFPFTLESGTSVTVPVRFVGLQEGVFVDTLCVRGTCIDRPLIAFNHEVVRDDSIPHATVISDSCLENIQVVIEEVGAKEHGIESWNVEHLSNCTVVVTQDELPERLIISLSKTDERQGIGYEITVRDSSGNVTTVSDTLAPVGIEFVQDDAELVTVHTLTGRFVCKTLTMYNYSEFATTIDDATMEHYIEWSYPLSQLPIQIPAFDTATFEVCFRAEDVGVFTDRLELFSGCIGTAIDLVGTVEPLIGAGTSRCEMILNGEQVVADQLTAESLFPNPSNSLISTTLHVPHEAEIQFALVTLNGTPIESGTMGTRKAGSYIVTLSVEGLSDGMYVLVVSDGLHSIQQKISVVR